MSLLLDIHVVLWWLTDDATLADDVKDQIDNEADVYISHEHAIAAGRLPPIHRDPFDRMLIAQARLEELTLVTRDGDIQKYDVDVLAV